MTLIFNACPNINPFSSILEIFDEEISQCCKGNVVGTCCRTNGGFDSINEILLGKANIYFALFTTRTGLYMTCSCCITVAALLQQSGGINMAWLSVDRVTGVENARRECSRELPYYLRYKSRSKYG